MKLLSLVFLVFGILSVKAEIETDENVLVLTDENFDEALKDNKFILVEFCKSLILIIYIFILYFIIVTKFC